MARKLTREDYDALFADMSPRARRWFVRKAVNLTARAMKDASLDPELTPGQRAAVASQALKNLELVAGIHARARADEEAAVRIMQALSKAGEPEGRAPKGSPPHIAAVWDLFKAGDADAERVVREWLEGITRGPGATGGS